MVRHVYNGKVISNKREGNAHLEMYGGTLDGLNIRGEFWQTADVWQV